MLLGVGISFTVSAIGDGHKAVRFSGVLY